MNKAPIALITGAARGIGAAIALKLAQTGMDIAILDIIEAGEISEAIKATGQTALTIVGDVTNHDDRQRALDEI